MNNETAEAPEFDGWKLNEMPVEELLESFRQNYGVALVGPDKEIRASGKSAAYVLNAEIERRLKLFYSLEIIVTENPAIQDMIDAALEKSLEQMRAEATPEENARVSRALEAHEPEKGEG